MSFSTIAFETPLTPINNAGISTLSPYSTCRHHDHAPIETYCFKTPLGRRPNPSTPIPSRKRGSTHRKENEPYGDALPSLNEAEPPSKKRKTIGDKLDSIFLAIRKEKLTFGEQGSLGKVRFCNARLESREIARITNIKKLNNPVLPAPVAIVATTSSPSSARHIPSH